MKKSSLLPVSQNRAMTRLEERLAALAASGETITYGALARDLGWRMADLTTALEQLMEQDARTGRPQRAALLEGRLSNGLPAQGFFLKLSELGITPDDFVRYVQETRARLHG